MRPANTSACLFNLSLFHLHSRTHFENLSSSAAACLAAWLPARPSGQRTDHPCAASAPSRRRHLASATATASATAQPRTSCAPRYRLLAACFLCKLYFAHDCPTFPLHCLARASSKEDKRRTQLHGLERALFLHPTSTSALGKNRHVVVEARKTTIFAHLPSIGLYLSRRPRPMPPHGTQPAAPCADDV